VVFASLSCAIKSPSIELKAYYKGCTIVRCQSVLKFIQGDVMQSKLTIGKVAKAASVNIETIRFYQRKGLIAEPAKALGGFRYYSEKCIEEIHFIKRAQAIGFTLEDIKELLAMEACDACQQTHDASLIKLNMVNARIAELERIRETLRELIGKCEKENYETACPIIDSLHKH